MLAPGRPQVGNLSYRLRQRINRIRSLAEQPPLALQPKPASLRQLRFITCSFALRLGGNRGAHQLRGSAQLDVVVGA